jgi:hypothetical protein
MEINSLKEYDPTFVLFLLNGMSDENQDIASSCVQMLEEHGKHMREALIQLGEEEDALMVD